MKPPYRGSHLLNTKQNEADLPIQSPAVPDHWKPPCKENMPPFDRKQKRNRQSSLFHFTNKCHVFLEGSRGGGCREAKGSLHIAVNLLNGEETFPH